MTAEIAIVITEFPTSFDAFLMSHRNEHRWKITLDITRASLQCGFADVQWGVSSAGKLFHTHGIHMASLQCGFFGVPEDASYSRKPSHTHHTHRASLHCAFSGVQQELNYDWKPFHTHHIHMVSPHCGFSGDHHNMDIDFVKLPDLSNIITMQMGQKNIAS